MGSIPRVGDEYAGYRIESVLGKGGMSVVYRAENIRLGTEVALKIMAPELAEDDVFRERFVRESRIAASINHPCVITIYDAGSADDLLYIAMRYIRGGDLKVLLRAEAPLDLERVQTIISQAGSALDEAHAHNLIHRDVKPANILLYKRDDTGRDHVFLTDFGLTKHPGSRTGLTDSGQFVGTIDYCAPEQIQGHSIDRRVDIYSLGCVLYECLTGTPPFRKETEVAVIWAHVQEEPPPPSSLRPELSPGLDAVVAKAMAKSPDDRYSTCAEFVGALAVEVVGNLPRAAHGAPSTHEVAVGADRGSGSLGVGAGVAGAGAAEAPTRMRTVLGSGGDSAPQQVGPPMPTGTEAGSTGAGSTDAGESGRTPPAPLPPSPPGPARPRRSRRSALVAALAAAMVVAAVAGLAVGRWVIPSRAASPQVSMPPDGGTQGMGGKPCTINGETLQADSLACVLRDHIPNPETRTGDHAGDPNIQTHCSVFEQAIPGLGDVGKTLGSQTILKCTAPSNVDVYYAIYHDRREVATDYQNICSFVRNKNCEQADYGTGNQAVDCTSTAAPQESQWYVENPLNTSAVVHILGHRSADEVKRLRESGDLIPILPTNGRYLCWAIGGRAYIVWSDADLPALMVAETDDAGSAHLFDEWQNVLGPDHPGALDEM